MKNPNLVRALEALSKVKTLLQASASRLYVEREADGSNYGGWIVPDADQAILESQIADITKQKTGQSLDFYVKQYENLPDIGSKPKISLLSAIVKLSAKHDPNAVSAALQATGGDVSKANGLLNVGYSFHKDDEDYAYSVVDEIGGPQNLGKETVLAYFDFEKYGRDLMLETVHGDTKDGRIVVFHIPKKKKEGV